MINYNNLTFIDFETTGFKENAPVSLAIINFQNAKKNKQIYEIINPETEIELGAQNVHGISLEEAKKHLSFNQLWPSISQLFENCIICAHNTSYDVFKVLIPTLKKYNLSLPTNFYVCDTLENAKKLIPKSEVPNYRLGTMCEYFGIKLDNWHSADADTLACVKVFNKLVKLSNGDLIIRSRFNNIYVPNSKKEED